MYIVEDKNCA